MSQHYSPRGAPSTLAKSMLNDHDAVRRHRLTEDKIGRWIKQKTDRVNYLLDENYYGRPLDMFKDIVVDRLCPVYEGKWNS